MAEIMTDQPTQEKPTLQMKSDESNNNDDRNGIEKSIYDVLGGNDQELARRQYYDDEAEGYDYNDSQYDFPVSDRLATGSSKEDSRTETTADINRRDVKVEDGFRINNDPNDDYINDYHYSMDGNSKHESETDRHNQGQSSALELEQVRKLFIGGLDYKTTETTLKQHFEQFGEVTGCSVMRDPQSKRSRGFGFVIYANSSMVDKAQEARPHEVDGRVVQSKRAISREESGKQETQACVKRVFLGALSDDVEESELRDYFKEYGNIVNINIPSYKDTGKRRGFAFVDFDDYDPVDKIVLQKFHTIKDKRVEAKKAIPKADMDARRRGDPRSSMSVQMMSSMGLMNGPGGRIPRPGRGSAAYMGWEGGAPYGGTGYPAGYSNQANIDSYPPHYHSPSSYYGGASGWMMHSSQGSSPYGMRSHGANGAVYGRYSYANQSGGGWTASTEYGTSFPPVQSGSGGPMRLSYQHRGWGPYGTGYGSHRGRGYNP